jgi:hypothetical protein
MKKIPSGLDPQRPTRIYGEGWDGGCNEPVAKLYGVERTAQILNLDGGNNIKLNCLELTDHSSCIEFHGHGIAGSPDWKMPCKRDDPPFGDWAQTGIYAADSKNVTLKNLNIHGLAHTGIKAGRLENWLIEDVKIVANGWSGWDGDIEGDDSNTGTITFRRVDIEWNGCGERWPDGEIFGCWGQTAGGYGDGLGTGATGGDWIFEDTKFLHNTSDGLDLLYHVDDGSITIRRVMAEGNAGNQVKVRGDATIENTVIVGNCGFFAGKAFTGNVDNCRALGNVLSLSILPNTKIDIVNTTIYSQGDCLVLASECSQGLTGAERIVSRNNIFFGDTDYLQPDERSCLFYRDNCGEVEFNNDHSVIFGVKDNPCPLGANDLCADPKLVSVGDGGVYDMRLSNDSPAVDSGLAVGAPCGELQVPSNDYLKELRPKGAGVDRGAYEVR